MSNAKIIWDFLISHGLTSAGSAGVMGNLYAESALDPKNLEQRGNTKLNMTDEEYVNAVDKGTYTNFATDGFGLGLAQWTYKSRKADLLTYAKSQGKSIGDLQMQLGFLIKELKSDFPSVYKVVTSTNSVLEASNIMLLKFEQPNDMSQKVQELRASYSQKYYDEFAEKGESSMTNIDKILNLAQSQVGTVEQPKNSNNVKYNTWYYGHAVSGSAYPWCMAFTQWVYANAGYKLPYMTASCSGLLNWYKQHQPKRVFAGSGIAKPGDVIIFNFGHTGIVVKDNGNSITTIEGNTSSDNKGDQANGGGVFKRTRSKSLVTAYIRALDVTTINEPKEEPKAEAKKEEEEMTQEKFNEMMNNYLKDLATKSASDWSAADREWCESNGLIGGDENGNKMYKKFITREEMAALLHRFYGIIK